MELKLSSGMTKKDHLKSKKSIGTMHITVEGDSQHEQAIMLSLSNSSTGGA